MRRITGTARLYSTCVYHVGNSIEIHEKYRPAIRSWIEDFSKIVLNGDEDDGIIEAGVDASIKNRFEVKKLNISPRSLSRAAGGLLIIGYLLAVLDVSVPEKIESDKSGNISGDYFGPSKLLKLANISLQRHQRVANRSSLPFDIWGESLLDFLQKEIIFQGPFYTDEDIIPPCIRIATEVLL